MADIQQTTNLEPQQNPQVSEMSSKLSPIAKQTIITNEQINTLFKLDKYIQIEPKSPKMSQKHTFTYNYDDNFRTTEISSIHKPPTHRKLKSQQFGRDLPFFNQNSEIPGPGFYKSMSIFDPSSGKGAIISKGPDRNPIDGYINKEVLKNPPLTKYHIEDMDRFKSPSFTMGVKYRDFNRLKTEGDIHNNPGPGNYEQRQLFSPRGQNTAGYKSPSSIIYSPRSEKRFFELKFKTPGPGQYIGLTDLTANGVYISSSTPRGGSRIFDKQQRKFKFGNDYPQQRGIQFDNEVPGPGQYSVPSQFDKYNKSKDCLINKKKHK